MATPSTIAPERLAELLAGFETLRPGAQDILTYLAAIPLKRAAHQISTPEAVAALSTFRADLAGLGQRLGEGIRDDIDCLRFLTEVDNPLNRLRVLEVSTSTGIERVPIADVLAQVEPRLFATAARITGVVSAVQSERLTSRAQLEGIWNPLSPTWPKQESFEQFWSAAERAARLQTARRLAEQLMENQLYFDAHVNLVYELTPPTNTFTKEQLTPVVRALVTSEAQLLRDLAHNRPIDMALVTTVNAYRQVVVDAIATKVKAGDSYLSPDEEHVPSAARRGGSKARFNASIILNEMYGLAEAAKGVQIEETASINAFFGRLMQTEGLVLEGTAAPQL